jgi:prepilin-type N-terminal cleavage/methylation domain-containing protein
MTRVRQPLCRNARRPGFTLVEMLIVIAIIGILVALTASAVMQVMASQQVRAAEATLAKIDSALDHQWKAVIDAARDEYRKGQQPAAGLQSTLMTWAGNNTDLAQAGYVQLRLMQEFPISLNEARGSVALPAQNGVTPQMSAKSSYIKSLAGCPSGSPDDESAVCLFLALSQSRRGMVNSTEDSVGQSAIRSLASPPHNMNNFKAYVDTWGNPIWLGPLTRPPTFPTTAPYYYVLPEIVSAGPNGLAGDPDDLSSAKLRATGSRGDS